MNFLKQVSVFAALIVSLVHLCHADECQVTTKSGKIQGKLVDVLDGKICAFIGVPFAAAPLGKLRFKKPEPIEPWSVTLEATKPKPACVQPMTNISELGVDLKKGLNDREVLFGPIKYALEMTAITEISEDCLYMDIYTPVEISSEKNYPVIMNFVTMMFTKGASSMPSFDPSVMVMKGKVIVAIPQFRMGCLGFLHSGTPNIPGNMGMWDQLMAMKWMKENAPAFGGDSKLTLMGHDSGGWSAGFHSLAQASEGIADRVIMQSGSGLNHLMFFGETSARLRFERFVDAVKCPMPEKEESDEFRVPTDETIDCLQGKTWEEILDAQKSLQLSKKDVGCVPNEDKEFFGINPFDKTKQGSFNIPSVLMGTTSCEGCLIYSTLLGEAAPMFDGKPIPMTLSELIEYIKNKSGGMNASQMQMVLPMFYRRINKENPTEVLARSCELIGNVLFVCPDQIYLTGCAKAANCKAYYYQFDYRPTNSLFASWLTGAQHLEDIQFVFGKPLLQPEKYSKDEVELSSMIIESWTNFARTGDPSISNYNWKANAGKSKGYTLINGKGFKAAKGFPNNQCKDITRYYGMARSFLKSFDPTKQKEAVGPGSK